MKDKMTDSSSFILHPSLLPTPYSPLPSSSFILHPSSYGLPGIPIADRAIGGIGTFEWCRGEPSTSTANYAYYTCPGLAREP
jgi:hypothetical protein